MKSTELASLLRPFWQRDIAGSTFVSPNSAEYVIYTDGGTICYVADGETGGVIASGTDHAAIIQDAIDLAGVGGTLSFKRNLFYLDAPLEPLSDQCWFAHGATFIPTDDVSCLKIHVVDGFRLLGSLRILDNDTVTTSAAAIDAYSMRYAHFQHVIIRNYFNGIDLEGNTSGSGTNENVFVDIYMQVRNRGLNMAGSCHDNHFVQIWVKGPAPDDWGANAGIRVATGGTQGGNVIANCQVLDMQTCLDLPGAYEFWFGTVIADNAFGTAIYIGGPCEALFFDTIWASSSGNGVYIEGNEDDYPTTAADQLYIGKCYAWLNADYGVRFEGYVQKVSIGILHVQRNVNVGLAYNRWRNENIRITTAISFENGVGIDATGAGTGCAIINATILDGIVAPTNLEELGGTKETGAFQNRGTALILNGATTSVVTHGCAYTPAQIWLGHEHAETTGAYVSAKDATTFTITVPSAVSAQRSVHWQAEAVRKTVGGELLANADVEAGTSAPDDWDSSVSGATWDSTVYRTGFKSLNLNVSSATAEWIAAHFAVVADREYRVQGLVKGTGSSQTFLTIRWFSDTGGTTFISEDNAMLNATYTTWTPIVFYAQAPSSALSADVMFRCAASTTADINGDDFSVRMLM